MNPWSSYLPKKSPTRWIKPPSSIICARCRELKIDVLLEEHTVYGDVKMAGSSLLAFSNGPPKAMVEGILRDLSEYDRQEMFWLIAQRLVFDQERSLHPHCATCQTLKNTLWSLRVKPTLCTRKYNKDYSFRFEISGSMYSEMRLETDKPTSIGIPELGYPDGRIESCRLPKVKKVRPLINYTLIKSWLNRCQDDHAKCRIVLPSLINKLENIRLLDVCERRLVSYTVGMEFIALSYVWGGVSQPIMAKNSEVPSTLPLTIEHATMIVRKLDYRYLWVDSICIDQSDPIEKSEQIAAMDAVYSCASATLITLDSPHANSGIPGIPGVTSTDNVCNPRAQQVVALFRPQSKKVCPETGGKILLVTHHPALDQGLRNSPWSLRAWTYQEALLSRRRILIARHQAFFSCNQVDCSEDGLDPSRLQLEAVRSNSLVNPLHRADLSSEYRRFIAYTKLVLNYAKRRLTNDGDGLHAISAILSTWERELPCEKFLFALPRWAFREALLWYQIGKSTEDPKGRRKHLDNFPSWSWCGWPLNHLVYFGNFVGVHEDEQHIRTILPPLFISYDNQVLVSSCGDGKDKRESGVTSMDPVVFESLPWKVFAKLAEQDNELGEIGIRHQDNSNSYQPLTVRDIILSMSFKTSSYGVVAGALGGTVDLDVEEYEIMEDSTMAHHDCLLVSAPIPSSLRLYCIILLWQDSTRNTMTRMAKRAGVVTWPCDAPEFLEAWSHLNPRWDRFFLV